MSRPIALHSGPAAGFDEPFELMAACHDRMARSLALLLRLADHLPVHGADAAARDAASDLRRYFNIAAPLHHEDEERHVFPRLRREARGDLADRLERDHREMDSLWRRIDADLSEVMAGDAHAAAGVATRQRWQDFVALYRAHLRAEDDEAYPVVGPTLDADETARMGREMAARRNAPR